MKNIQEVLDIVEKAKAAFSTQLQELAARGGLSREMYIRYLTFQYHLTKGVQRHFFKKCRPSTPQRESKLEELPIQIWP